MPPDANVFHRFTTRHTSPPRWLVLLAVLGVLAAGCSSLENGSAIEAESAGDDGPTAVGPVLDGAADTTSTGSAVTVRRAGSISDTDWRRCQLLASGVTLLHPDGWLPDEVPLRSCSTFVPPGGGTDGDGITVEAAQGDLATTVTGLLANGWRLLPGWGLPPGIALGGPDGEVARLVPISSNDTLRVTGRSGTSLGDTETALLVTRMATSVRPVRAAGTPDAGSGPAGAPPEPTDRAPRSRVRPEPGSVALTFDDGPHPTWTPVVLELLDEYDATATFFVVGSAAERHPDLIREIVRRGHSVQNHTQDHERLTQVDDARVRAQLRAADRAITGAGAPGPRCMRPPYGAVDERVRNLTAEQGQDVVLWNIDTLDWRNPGVDQIIGEAVQAKDRDIILFHDGPGDRSQTVSALPWVLEFLTSSGFGFQRLCADPPAR